MDELETAVPAPSGGPSLVVVWPNGAVAHPLVPGAVTTLGRSEKCSIRVPVAGLSRMHLEIRLGHGLTITDLGSSSGTKVDGVRIQPLVPHVVGASSVVEAAEVTVLFKGILGAPIREVGAPGDVVDRVAQTSLSLMLLGETGVGKTRLAAEIHARSKRASGPFLSLNCASLPEGMLEGELFGYEKGAFTGAVVARPGLVESAAGGTLFLDEVAEMSLATQVKLLTVVESKSVLRLGERRARPVDVRFVAATNRDLAEEVSSGRFREDLYYRLCGYTIEVPPLRDRKHEIPSLARGFLAAASEAAGRPGMHLHPEALAQLAAHDWPGNVRELKNVVERAVALALTTEITAAEVAVVSARSATKRSAPGERGSSVVTEGGPRAEETEEAEIRRALDAAGGNQTRAARALGMPLRTFVRRLDHYGHSRPRRGP
ncbi:MAG: sigma 54-interacting transcriptional regulator [Myxococcales bacterium]|nr:sigma 54-interacting transcriptional regulator [Myxococcales bacterium]